MPPATITTSFPSAWSTGHPTPNGPRTPISSPADNRRMACVTEPTARVVCSRRPGLPGSPLIESGISPAPGTYTMLNWPGANAIVAAPLLAATSTVKVSSVSTRTWRIPYTSGRIGFKRSRFDIQIEQLKARGLEPQFDDLRDAFEHLVPEPGVALALGPQAPGIHHDRADQRQRPGVEMPLKRRK